MGYKQCIAGHSMDQLLSICSLCVQLMHCIWHKTSINKHLYWASPGELGKMLACVVPVQLQTLNIMCKLMQGFYMDLSGVRHLLGHGLQTMHIASHPMDQLLAICSLCVQLMHCKPRSLSERIWSLNIVKGEYGHTMATYLCKDLKLHNGFICEEGLK